MCALLSCDRWRKKAKQALELASSPFNVLLLLVVVVVVVAAVVRWSICTMFTMRFNLCSLRRQTVAPGDPEAYRGWSLVKETFVGAVDRQDVLSADPWYMIGS